ncbi:pilus assembly FimT family protein [Acaryochloris marina NIES-2412]|uniref:pilus assembly FimT family protein n=1 Tax=Acaryochloris marina TaxID=155978 RepID=UPI00405900B1
MGFTLTETIVLVVIIGIFATLSAPSFLGWLNQKKVDDALAKIEGAIKQTQREAIKRSQDCTVTIPKGIDQSISGNCLVTGSRQIEDVTIYYNHSAPHDISFNFKGLYTPPGTTLWVSIPNSSVKPKCLSISTGIGLMRTGNYDLGVDKCMRP